MKEIKYVTVFNDPDENQKMACKLSRNVANLSQSHPNTVLWGRKERSPLCLSSLTNVLILLCIIFLTHIYVLSVTVLTLWVAPPEIVCNWYRI